MIRTKGEKERTHRSGKDGREGAKRKRVRKEGPLVADRVLGPRLMKLSVEGVYR